jgi:hypothetical protein
MNPVAYRITSEETLYFLLVGEGQHFNPVAKCELEQSPRLWWLNIYSSAKTREIAMRKRKKASSDIIFIEWNVTMEQIIKEGKLGFPIVPDKVLASDKLDIFEQLWRIKR